MMMRRTRRSFGRGANDEDIPDDGRNMVMIARHDGLMAKVVVMKLALPSIAMILIPATLVSTVAWCLILKGRLQHSASVMFCQPFGRSLPCFAVRDLSNRTRGRNDIGLPKLDDWR